MPAKTPPHDPSQEELNALYAEFEYAFSKESEEITQAELREIQRLEKKLADAREVVKLVMKQRGARLRNIRLRVRRGQLIEEGPLGIVLNSHFGNSRQLIRKNENWDENDD